MPQVWPIGVFPPGPWGWFRDGHMTSQPMRFHCRVFLRTTKGEAGNIELELPEAVGTASRKGQNAHETTTEGSRAERWETEGSGHITGAPGPSHT